MTQESTKYIIHKPTSYVPVSITLLVLIIIDFFTYRIDNNAVAPFYRYFSNNDFYVCNCKIFSDQFGSSHYFVEFRSYNNITLIIAVGTTNYEIIS